MSVEYAVPSDNRMVVAVYNASTAAQISSGEVVRLSTGSTPNVYNVTRIGSTAGTVVRLFGVVEHKIATGGVGHCVIHGPAKAMANGAVTVKSPCTAQSGTTGIRGRVILATAGTAGTADNGKYLGWAMSVGATGSFMTVFVNTAHSNA